MCHFNFNQPQIVYMFVTVVFSPADSQQIISRGWPGLVSIHLEVCYYYYYYYYFHMVISLAIYTVDVSIMSFMWYMLPWWISKKIAIYVCCCCCHLLAYKTVKFFLLEKAWGWVWGKKLVSNCALWDFRNVLLMHMAWR